MINSTAVQATYIPTLLMQQQPSFVTEPTEKRHYAELPRKKQQVSQWAAPVHQLGQERTKELMGVQFAKNNILKT